VCPIAVPTRKGHIRRYRYLAHGKCLPLLQVCVGPRNVLHQAIKDVSASYDALGNLLESIEHFLKRLDIYTKISPVPALDEIMVKIIVGLLSTLALATKHSKQGGLSELNPTGMSANGSSI